MNSSFEALILHLLSLTILLAIDDPKMSSGSNTGGTGVTSQANSSASRTTGVSTSGTAGPMQTGEQRQDAAGVARNLNDPANRDLMQRMGDSSRERRGR